MKSILIGLLALGSISALAQVTENEFTFEEWKSDCYEKFVNNKDVSKSALNQAMSCTAGKKLNVSTDFGVQDPFKSQTRPLDVKLQTAYNKCSIAYDMLADSKTFGETYHNRAAVSALFFCMGQNP